MNRKTIIFLLLCLYPFCSYAQHSSTEDSLHITDNTVVFRPVRLALPVSLVTVGIIGVITPQLKTINRHVRNGMADLRQNCYFHADDYMQYLPVVSNFGLSLFGAKPKHSYLDRTLVTATSYAAMGVLVNVIKWGVNEQRPDGSAHNSFPSGHTATAFMGAELVRMEYRDDSPLYGVGAYTIACGVAFLRLYNERHWCNDILAGAGIGILSARIGFWLLPLERKLFGLDKVYSKEIEMTFVPYYEHTSKSVGGMFALRF